MSKGDVALIHELTGAVAASDWERFEARIHPAVEWEHNIGTGSPEEGVYRGRHEVGELFERIRSTWRTMDLAITEIRELGAGRYAVSGDMVTKHAASEAEFASRYEQEFEIRDGVLVKGRMRVAPGGRPPARTSVPSVVNDVQKEER